MLVLVSRPHSKQSLESVWGECFFLPCSLSSLVLCWLLCVLVLTSASEYFQIESKLIIAIDSEFVYRGPTSHVGKLLSDAHVNEHGHSSEELTSAVRTVYGCHKYVSG